MESDAWPNMTVLGVQFGSSLCLLSILLFYNFIVLVGFVRETSDETASPLSKVAWGLGVLAAFLGPCSWIVALLAIVIARIETGRIYREESPIRSATPARMASINGGLLLVLWFLMTAGLGLNVAF